MEEKSDTFVAAFRVEYFMRSITGAITAVGMLL